MRAQAAIFPKNNNRLQPAWQEIVNFLFQRLGRLDRVISWPPGTPSEVIKLIPHWAMESTSVKIPQAVAAAQYTSFIVVKMECVIQV